MKKLKAEMWDKVQYIFRNYYDGMIHCAIVYRGKVDETLLRRAIKLVVDKVDVLHSSFVAHPIDPYWRVNDDYTEEEMLDVVYGDVSHEKIEELLVRHVDYRGKLQFKATLVKESGDKSVLCFVINHICCDGRDFIRLMGEICAAYRSLALYGAYKSDIASGSRGAEQIYRDLPEHVRKKARRLYKNISGTDIKTKFPFEQETEADKPHIARAKLSADVMSALKVRGKAEGYTVNDIYLAAYFRAVKAFCSLSEDCPAEITSMLDMRRYLKDGKTEGLTNLTSYMQCKLLSGIGRDMTDTLTRVAEALAPQKSDPTLGMAGLPLMALGLRFPFFIGSALVKLGYSNPLFTMSNMGVLNADDLALAEAKAEDAFFTGTVKYKPYIQIACTTMNGEATFTVCEKCSDRDKRAIRAFLDRFTGELERYAKGSR